MKHNSGVPEEVVKGPEGFGSRLTGNRMPKKKAVIIARAAIQGYVASQYRLGIAYESGKGEDQSFSTPTLV